MRGHEVTWRNPLPEEFRLYQLVKLTGWTVAQIDDTPAEQLDWLLKIDATIEEARQEAEKRARK